MTLIIKKPTSGKLVMAKSFVLSPATWNPNMIATELWLDAADANTITLNGSTVSQWNDKSGKGRNVSQATAANQPSYVTNVLNGNAVLDWGTSVSNKGLTLALSQYSPARYFGVAEYDGPDPFSGYIGLITHNFNGNADLLLTSDIGSTWFGGNSVFLNGAATSSATALPTISNPFVFATNFTTNSNKEQLFVGRDRNETNRSWRGKIAEIIATTAVPSTLDKQRIEGYLAHKWGLTANLPSDHPYKTMGPIP